MGGSMSVLGKVAQLAVSIAIPLGGGFAIGMWTAPEVKTWYKKIKKPTWNPPNWLFGPVWSLLYIAQGVASYLVFRNGFSKNLVPLSLYFTQLLVNFAWNPLFFKAHRIDLALADIVALDVLVATTFAQFKNVIGLPVAAGLFAPYGAWISFATVLNAWILANNPKKGTSETEPLLEGGSSVLASAQEAAQKVAADVASTAGAATEKVNAVAASTTQAVGEKVEELKEKAEEKVEEGKEKVAEVKEKVEDAVEGATEAAEAPGPVAEKPEEAAK